MKLEITTEELRDLVNPPATVPTVGMPTSYSSDEIARMIADVGNTNKIAAIKLHRAMTGSYLKDAKDAIERYWRTVPMQNPY